MLLKTTNYRLLCKSNFKLKREKKLERRNARQREREKKRNNCSHFPLCTITCILNDDEIAEMANKIGEVDRLYKYTTSRLLDQIAL